MVRHTSRDAASVLRAVAVAHLVRARLLAVVVVPPAGAAPTLLFPHVASSAVLGPALEALDAESCVEWLTALAPGADVIVRRGAVAGVAVDVAKERRPDLIVVGRVDLERPRDGAHVARASGCATLVAGEAMHSTVLAATDLLHADLPVLRAASALAVAAEAPLLAVHHIPTLVIEPITITGVPSSVDLSPGEIQRKRRELDGAVRRLGGEVESLVTSGPHTAGALLSEARSRDVEIVVVGASASSWVERLIFGSTADELLDLAQRSVLVIPLGDRRA